MSKDAQKQSLLDAVTQLRLAEQLLIQASRATSDIPTLMQINVEYSHLDSFLSQLLQAQAIADDTDFAHAISSLKQQGSILQTEEDDIKKVVADVGTAARIAGYLVQTASIIAKL
jgi:predicted negative regulator of RcsB-dependent stress response